MTGLGLPTTSQPIIYKESYSSMMQKGKRPCIAATMTLLLRVWDFMPLYTGSTVLICVGLLSGSVSCFVQYFIQTFIRPTFLISTNDGHNPTYDNTYSRLFFLHHMLVDVHTTAMLLRKIHKGNTICPLYIIEILICKVTSVLTNLKLVLATFGC